MGFNPTYVDKLFERFQRLHSPEEFNAMGIGIDFAFRPVGPAFARLATEGSSPELESTIGGAIDGAIRYVLGLYALLILIAFLGVTKFL